MDGGGCSDSGGCDPGGYADGAGSSAAYSSYDAVRVKKLAEMSPEDKAKFMAKEARAETKFLCFVAMGIIAIASVHPLTNYFQSKSSYGAQEIVQCVQNFQNSQSNAFFGIQPTDSQHAVLDDCNTLVGRYIKGDNPQNVQDFQLPENISNNIMLMRQKALVNSASKVTPN